jgi:methionyl-tRNA formyltransferase
MTQSKYSRLVFMGTPEFALPSLQALMEAGEEVVSVYTQPDRPKGRGRKLTPSPIKEWALSRNLPVFQPPSFKEPEHRNRLAADRPDLLIVVAYGLILPPAVLSLPAWGAVNVHASLLPRYRGAAPIQWAVINGEAETGVTTMRLDAGMDTGDILLQERVPIKATDSSQTLHDRLSVLGGALLVKTLDELRRGTLRPRPQDPAQASYAPSLKKEQGEIRWNLSAPRIDCWIRGLTPWPGAFTFLKGKRLIIHRAVPEPNQNLEIPGTVVAMEGGEIKVATGQGLLVVEELQLEGHRRMPARELVKGASLQVGDRLGR